MALTKKELKLRIKSVKSTQKITLAMKMVAASKLRKARTSLEQSHFYEKEITKIVLNLLSQDFENKCEISLVSARENSNIHLLIVLSSDRGLCGGFNSSIIKYLKKISKELIEQGKIIKILCIGSKGAEQLKYHKIGDVVENILDITKQEVSFFDAQNIASKIIKYFENNNFASCSILFNKYKSAILSEPTELDIIPIENLNLTEDREGNANYEFDQDAEKILKNIIPTYIAVKIFYALLESASSEQASRMTAMDNATQAAGDMIKSLSLTYNRTRQASITRELIEIISGAEAL